MSIYFVHMMQAFLGLTVLLASWEKRLTYRRLVWAAIIGIGIGIVLYKFANFYLIDSTLKLYTEITLLGLLLLSALWMRIPFVGAQYGYLTLLSLGYGIEYASIGRDFPLLKGTLLDTLSIVSLGIVLLAALMLIVALRLLGTSYASMPLFARRTLYMFTVLLLILTLAGQTGIALMRLGLLPTSGWLLSIVAKLLHYAAFFPYLYLFFIGIIIGVYGRGKPLACVKSEVGSIAYRKNRAVRAQIRSTQSVLLVFTITSGLFLLYYDLNASRPPSLSTPEILTPQNGEFVIAMETLRDNDLHRYAYVTDEGKKIRFFALNRYKDKDAPVAVYDSCMICGDMGYVKKGDELICISCNVRIFIPSVGKEGGCNPIPFPFTFDGNALHVKLETILKGANYFSEVVEKEVVDPVSKTKLINLKAPKTYMYNGKTYFFENEKNYEAFKETPERYVDENASLQTFWRAKGYEALSEETKQ